MKILTLYLETPDSAFHVRGLVREIEEEINSVRRELKNLEDFGLLHSEKKGNKIIFTVNKKCLFLSELQNLFAKNTPAVLLITKYLNKIKNIDLAILTHRFFSKQYEHSTDVDIILIGNPNVNQLKEHIATLESDLKRTIRVSLFTMEAFEFKKKNRDMYLADILRNKHIVLVGDRKLLLG